MDDWGFHKINCKTSLLRIVEDSPIPINKLWIAKDSKFFKENINKLLEISNDNEPTWTFFYSRPPHPPFIFNKDGTLRDKKEYDQDFATNLTDTWSENTKEMYVNQIKYINTEFLKIFDEIIKSSNIKPIIIIHSDHGIHNFSGSIGEEKLNDTSEAVIDEHFNILTSLYTIDNCRKIAEKDITSVNIIRTILRKCFEFDIKNTSDNSYWSHRHKNEFITVKE